MTRMAACYFCGTVLEAPEPVRPAGDGGPALELCDDCEAKLERVLAAVGGPADVATAPETGSPGPAGAENRADREVEPAGNGETAAEPGDDGETPAAPAAGETDEARQAGADTGSEDGDGGAPADAGDDTDDGSAASPGSGRGDVDADGDAADPAVSLAERDVSPADYKRVLRLLQNREFPVERAEIEAVLTSAYEFSPETVEAVLEAAVDRGVVATDGEGHLVAPE